MKNIEDCLEKLSFKVSNVSFNPNPRSVYPHVTQWDQQFINDVANHTLGGSALSTAQSHIVVKLLSRYINLFDKTDQPIVSAIIQAGTFRTPLYQSTSAPREVRWAGGSTLLFRSQYNPAIQAGLKDIPSALREIIPRHTIPGKKTWKVVVDETNHKQVMEFIKKHSFDFDDNVLTLFMNIQNNLNTPSSIRLENGEIKVDINNDVLSCLWLEEMDWLRNV